MHHSCGRGSAMKSGGWDVNGEVIAVFTPNFTSLTTEALHMLHRSPQMLEQLYRKWNCILLCSTSCSFLWVNPPHDNKHCGGRANTYLTPHWKHLALHWKVYCTKHKGVQYLPTETLAVLRNIYPMAWEQGLMDVRCNYSLGSIAIVYCCI